MIRVRFSTGLVLQYNDLDSSYREGGRLYLSQKCKPGYYNVIVPEGCVIEHVAPFRVYRDGDDRTADLVALVEQVSALTDTLNKARRANSLLRKRLTQAAPTKRGKR